MKKDNLPLLKTFKKWTTDQVKLDDVNDAINPSMPPSTTIGAGVRAGKTIYDYISEEDNNED